MAPRLLERLLALLDRKAGRGCSSRKPSGEIAALLLPMPPGAAARRPSSASVRRNHHSGEQS